MTINGTHGNRWHPMAIIPLDGNQRQPRQSKAPERAAAPCGCVGRRSGSPAGWARRPTSGARRRCPRARSSEGGRRRSSPRGACAVARDHEIVEARSEIVSGGHGRWREIGGSSAEIAPAQALELARGLGPDGVLLVGRRRCEVALTRAQLVLLDLAEGCPGGEQVRSDEISGD